MHWLEQVRRKREIGFDFFLGKTESELTQLLSLEMISRHIQVSESPAAAHLHLYRERGSGDAKGDRKEGGGSTEVDKQQLGMHQEWGELARHRFWQERWDERANAGLKRLWMTWEICRRILGQEGARGYRHGRISVSALMKLSPRHY